MNEIDVTENVVTKKRLPKIKLKKYAMLAAVVTLTMACVVFASGVDITNPVQKLVEQIWVVFKSIGYILLAWSVGSLIMAFKNEDADSKSRNAMLLVVSLLLMNLKSIFDYLGITL